MQPTYLLSRTLNFSHIDNRGISRPSTLFDLMQDAATVHAYALGIDKDSLGIYWVLSRMKAHQSRPFFPGDALRIQTVFEGIKGVSWLRSFRFTDDTGAQVAQATSSWVMLDPESHRILRPKDIPAVLPFAVPPSPEFDVPGKLGDCLLTPHHVHTVRYSDLDVNCHLNNVKTVDIIADGLELDRRNDYFVSDMQVCYTAECLCGEAITLHTGMDASGMEYVSGRTDAALKFEAAARLSPYEKKV